MPHEDVAVDLFIAAGTNAVYDPRALNVLENVVPYRFYPVRVNGPWRKVAG